jgi:hypothetical protein
MKKRFFIFIFVALFMFLIAACDEIETQELTGIVFIGVENVTVEFDEPFNILDGVTAVGNDGVDYTENMTFATIGPVDEEGNLDTTSTGTHAVRYEVRIGTVLAQQWREITVNTPERPDGLVSNNDFSLGVVFWEDGLYIADGAAMTLSTEDGALKAEVVAGSNAWTPRFGQQNIPFEQGKSYEVTFSAKSSVAKTINVNVGELLTNDPWFVDFKPGQTEQFDLTTEYAEYSFAFTMALDNPRGGILFELGNVNGQVDATVWFDYVNAVEIEDLEDTVAPQFSGIRATRTLLAGADFDPMAGVTAFDNVDGDVTEDVVVTVYLVDGEEEVEVTDLTNLAVGVYRVVYFVSDAAGNERTQEAALTVSEDMTPPTLEYPGWRVFVNDWEGSAAGFELVDGELVMTVTSANFHSNWTLQIIQDAFALGYGEDNVGHMMLEAGQTYRVTFDAKASVAGQVTLAIGHSETGWTEYFAQPGVEITTEMQTFEVEFTLDAEGNFDVPAQFKLEMGLLFAGQEVPQTFTLDNVMIEMHDGEAFVETDLIFNGTMDDAPAHLPYLVNEWRTFTNSWEGTNAELYGLNGELVFQINDINVWENWQLQVIQDAFALGTGEDNVGHMLLEAGQTYRVTFDARASQVGAFNLAIGHAGGGWTPYHAEADLEIGLDMQTYTVTFTLDAEGDYTTLAQFKLEMGLLFAGAAGPQYFYLDNVMIEVLEGEDFVDAELIVNGEMN